MGVKLSIESTVMKANFKDQFSNYPYWIAGLLTGVLATSYAMLFKKLAGISFDLFLTHFWIWAALVPVGFFFSWYSVKAFSPEASGSGIPQVMAAIQKGGAQHLEWYQRLLGLKVVLVKIASSLFSVVVGGAVGREGPTIQIGASVFNLIFPYVSTNPGEESKKRKALILAGGAAGLAAAFNTPLGGIVFAIEELATDSFRQFRSTILLAVIVSGMTAQWFTGSYLYLGHPAVQEMQPIFLAYSVVVALLGGAFGGIFGLMLFKLIKIRKAALNFKNHLAWILGLSILFVAFAYFSKGLALGPGTEGITSILENKPATSIFDVLTRYFANQISYVVGGAGGIFSPALSIGANFGSFMGTLFFHSGAGTNLMVIVGMVSFLTGVTHAPFTSLVLVLEMMDQPVLTVPVMLGALLAHSAARMIDSHSFYEHMSEAYVP
jgi:H+/Cl- antiporter ClcA